MNRHICGKTLSLPVRVVISEYFNPALYREWVTPFEYRLDLCPVGVQYAATS